MPVGHGTHDGSYGQAVEIVIDEDQNAQGHGGKLGAHTGPDPLGGPLAEGCGAARPVHQLDDNAQKDQEDQDADIVGIRHGMDHAVIDAFTALLHRFHENVVQSAHKAAAGIKEAADHDADEERAVDLFGHQGQGNGNDGRQERPESSVQCCS